MPILYKEIKGEHLVENVGQITFLTKPIGQIQREIYISLFGFDAYLQNFSKIDITSALIKPLNFGLVNDKNLPIIEITIDY